MTASTERRLTAIPIRRTAAATLPRSTGFRSRTCACCCSTRATTSSTDSPPTSTATDATRGTTTRCSSTSGSRSDGSHAMRTFAATIVGSALASAVASAQVATPPAEINYDKAGEERAVNPYSTCHGPRGISTSPEFPILAAQRAGYLEAQIEAFRSKTREEKAAHDFMYGIAGNLNDPRVIAVIAHYYASQPPAPGRPGDPAIVAKGKEFFDKGSPDRGIPPCASCHGANAEGMADF